MKMAEIESKKQARDPGGLIAALEDEDEHVRAAEVLERVKFRDPGVAVRRAASHAHGTVIERLQEQRGELPLKGGACGPRRHDRGYAVMQENAACRQRPRPFPQPIPSFFEHSPDEAA